MKLNTFERRQLLSVVSKSNRREYLSYSEYCIQCAVLKDSEELNLDLVCFECRPAKKFTQKEINDAIEAVNKQMKEQKC
tara:strand:+ start:33176 stop:33412 length:237 start_codon:yes stop_codon:yes gene_type:complete